ncbi:hypothetical protein AVEN_145197-1 [Araneus ventricosus]|uniref:Uncharacterized protein n=1 Tax=Araneus ventricosus TaxID=182803 RepID=A0A4Y2Q580_ARAVE|nr:hypothetical protein AVEN_145197-1 [Araneus ventricosus]
MRQLKILNENLQRRLKERGEELENRKERKLDMSFRWSRRIPTPLSGFVEEAVGGQEYRVDQDVAPFLEASLSPFFKRARYLGCHHRHKGHKPPSYFRALIEDKVVYLGESEC